MYVNNKVKNCQEAGGTLIYKPPARYIDGKHLKPVTNLMRLSIPKNMIFKGHVFKEVGTRKNPCLINVRTCVLIPRTHINSRVWEHAPEIPAGVQKRELP